MTLEPGPSGISHIHAERGEIKSISKNSSYTSQLSSRHATQKKHLKQEQENDDSFNYYRYHTIYHFTPSVNIIYAPSYFCLTELHISMTFVWYSIVIPDFSLLASKSIGNTYTILSFIFTWRNGYCGQWIWCANFKSWLFVFICALMSFVKYISIFTLHTQ